MSSFIIHEVDCAENTVVYREASVEEALNLSSLQQPEPTVDPKLESLKRAAKQASPELYDFVCYVLGVSNDSE